jgi:hypothetical protein
MKIRLAKEDETALKKLSNLYESWKKSVVFANEFYNWSRAQGMDDRSCIQGYTSCPFDESCVRIEIKKRMHERVSSN